jgi:hypothetical protein
MLVQWSFDIDLDLHPGGLPCTHAANDQEQGKNHGAIKQIIDSRH